jgi:hypothetical protein
MTIAMITSTTAHGRSFDHTIEEVAFGRDLYDVALTVTYRGGTDWCAEIARFEPSYELDEPPATREQIKRALDTLAHQDSIREAVIARLRDDDEEAAEYSLEYRRELRRMRRMFL